MDGHATIQGEGGGGSDQQSAENQAAAVAAAGADDSAGDKDNSADSSSSKTGANGSSGKSKAGSAGKAPTAAKPKTPDTKPKDKCTAAKTEVAKLESRPPSVSREEAKTYFKELAAGGVIGCAVGALGDEAGTGGTGTPMVVGACAVGGIEGVETANAVFVLSHPMVLFNSAASQAKLAAAKVEAFVACQ